MEPYEPIPGRPPRKVVIDRQRKLFASLKIEELLLELIPNIHEQSKVDWLPLEPFDDNEYDVWTPQEWIESESTDKFEPVPGQGLWRDSDNKGIWRRCLIYKYDEDWQMYEGVWDDGTTEKSELTWINLLFDAEDPWMFAQRVAKAYQDWIFADSIIRYNFFIDNMPTDDLPELDPEQQNWIKSMAESCRYLKTKSNLDFSTIMSEV
mgnify:CR=1 FL=1